MGAGRRRRRMRRSSWRLVRLRGRNLEPAVRRRLRAVRGRARHAWWLDSSQTRADAYSMNDSINYIPRDGLNQPGQLLLLLPCAADAPSRCARPCSSSPVSRLRRALGARNGGTEQGDRVASPVDGRQLSRWRARKADGRVLRLMTRCLDRQAWPLRTWRCMQSAKNGSSVNDIRMHSQVFIQSAVSCITARRQK